MRPRTPRNATSGQILLPALAIYLGLLVLFFGVIYLGRVTLTRMRIETAAQAAALSACRAQAQLLNNCAGHNLKLNGFVPLSWHGMGATEIGMKDELEAWLEEQKIEGLWKYIQGGLLGWPVSVGNTVARLNGGTPFFHYPLKIDPRLQPTELDVVYFDGYIPVDYEEYPDAYYVRLWRPDERRVQPPHRATWCVESGTVQDCETAHLYLDIDANTSHNGGFPRPDGVFWEDFEIQSLWPQFNAKLVSTPLAVTEIAKHGGLRF